jgi:predicted GIY-YIG superfamily endonuclease
MAGTVYLLHFDTRYKHAGHYVGFTFDLESRVADHLAGRGARLMEVIVDAGIGARLARTWSGSRRLERRIKNGKATPRLCPVCNPRAMRRLKDVASVKH